MSTTDNCISYHNLALVDQSSDLVVSKLKGILVYNVRCSIDLKSFRTCCDNDHPEFWFMATVLDKYEPDGLVDYCIFMEVDPETLEVSWNAHKSAYYRITISDEGRKILDDMVIKTMQKFVNA